MTWYSLIPAIIAVLWAGASWLKAHSVNQKLNDHLNGRVDLPPPR